MKVLATSAVCFYLLQICFSHQVNEKFDDGKYVVSVSHDSATDVITVQVDVKTTGWVGFGFAKEPSTSMNHYDVVVGGVKNSTGYLNDFYTQGHTLPPKDAKQNYNLTMSKEENGTTTLRFIRKRDTNDSKDLLIQPGVRVSLVWAYHLSAEADNPTSFSRHSVRGVTSKEYVIVPGDGPTKAPTSKASKAPTSEASFCRAGALFPDVFALMASFFAVFL